MSWFMYCGDVWEMKFRGGIFGDAWNHLCASLSLFFGKLQSRRWAEEIEVRPTVFEL